MHISLLILAIAESNIADTFSSLVIFHHFSLVKYRAGLRIMSLNGFWLKKVINTSIKIKDLARYNTYDWFELNLRLKRPSI
jgi:hypothetical protein